MSVLKWKNHYSVHGKTLGETFCINLSINQSINNGLEPEDNNSTNNIINVQSLKQVFKFKAVPRETQVEHWTWSIGGHATIGIKPLINLEEI